MKNEVMAVDRYEFNLKLEQLKKMIDKKDYATAAKISDSVEWDRVHSNSLLELVAEVYEINKEYVKAKDILLIEYERVTMGRRIAYRLAVLSAKLGQVKEAEGFYNDFVTMSPLDNSKYLLRYIIEEAKGRPVNELLKYIEVYLQGDMDDKWAYVLASMYHKCGMGDKCADMCDSIILWFGDGPYVERARKLKEIYRPDSYNANVKKEKEILRETWGVPDEKEENEEEPEYAGSENDVPMEIEPENTFADIEENHDDIDINENIEAEIVADENTEDEGIEYKDNENEDIEDNNIDVSDFSIRTYDADNKYNTFNIQAEIARSMSLLMSDAYYDENYNDADIVNEPTKEVKFKSKISRVSKGSSVSEPEKTEKSETPAKPEAEYVVPDNRPIAPMYELEGDGQIGIYVEKNGKERSNDEIEGQITIEQILAGYDVVAVEPDEPEFDEPETVEVDLGNEDFDEPDSAESDVEPETESEPEPEIEIKIEIPTEDAPDAEEDDADKESKNPEKAEENSRIDLKGELKKFVLHYGNITGLDKQIILKIEDIVKSHDKSGTSSTGNIFVTGDVRSGKSSLAVDLIKLINAIRHRGGRKIAKTNAIILNRQDIREAFNMLENTDIIIEKASSLSDKNVEELIRILREFTGGMIVVFEDEKTAMEQMFKIYPEIAEMFANVISIKEFSLSEWADIGRKYALENGYEIDEMGLLALHSVINKIYSATGNIEMKDIEEIIDDAIYSANSGIGNAITRLFRRNKNNKEHGVLKEEDFE